MTLLKQKKITPYSAKLLFDIVLDVESYPEFIPWCKYVRIISKSDHEFVAEMTVQFKGFVEKYCSNIKYYSDGNKYLIDVTSASGPFKYLHNRWAFDTIGCETEIDFAIDFQFKSVLLDKIIGLFFYEATKRMMQAFEDRALFVSKNI